MKTSNTRRVVSALLGLPIIAAFVLSMLLLAPLGASAQVTQHVVTPNSQALVFNQAMRKLWHDEILQMADMLTWGIVKQFPKQFR